MKSLSQPDLIRKGLVTEHLLSKSKYTKITVVKTFKLLKYKMVIQWKLPNGNKIW